MKWKNYKTPLIVFFVTLLLISSSFLSVGAKTNNEFKVWIDGKELSVSGILVDEKSVLVPMYSFFKEFGIIARISYDSSKKAEIITGQKDGTTIELVKNEKIPKVNGKEVNALPVPAQVLNRMTYVPVDFIAESFGATLSVDNAQKIINIRTKSGYVEEQTYPFQLLPLAYDYDALEPHIDKETMHIHHTRHHQAYVNGANNALVKYPDLWGKTAKELLANIGTMPRDIQGAIRNHVGGHVNHALFWEIMSPDGGGEPTGKLLEDINATFGSYENFKKEFVAAAAQRFGSGWAWLVVDNGKLVVTHTGNQDSPLMYGQTPIIGLDVWEHAYYLNYQNQRGSYTNAFFNVLNWDEVARLYEMALVENANKPGYVENQSYPFSLLPLAYSYDGLEPYIDKETMYIHHTRHHQAYINNANNALKNYPELQGKTAKELLVEIEKMPKELQNTIKNNVGGHVNHAMFWMIMSPNGGGKPTGDLLEAINAQFGSFEEFQKEFNAAAARRFGSGWAWLVVEDGKLRVTDTGNQDSPLMYGQTPILGIDVWEHAYYLKYQNQRGSYTSAFFNVIDWNEVAKLYAEAMK